MLFWVYTYAFPSLRTVLHKFYAQSTNTTHSPAAFLAFANPLFSPLIYTSCLAPISSTITVWQSSGELCPASEYCMVVGGYSLFWSSIYNWKALCALASPVDTYLRSSWRYIRGNPQAGAISSNWFEIDGSQVTNEFLRNCSSKRFYAQHTSIKNLILWIKHKHTSGNDLKTKLQFKSKNINKGGVM